MGEITGRLAARYDATVPGTSLPVIVTTTGPVDSSVLASARETGADNVRRLDFVSNTYAARATREEAEALAGLSSTRAVQYNEPVVITGVDLDVR